MSTFKLKGRDTRPTMEVFLLDPDGTAHDLTGSSSWKLHVKIGGAVFSRDMTPDGDLTSGILRYTWLATDWTTGTPVLVPGTHRMEYEVIGSSGARLTWPNEGYDSLVVTADLGQGT